MTSLHYMYNSATTPIKRDLMENIASGTKPFLKWAGGKRQLIPELMRHVPKNYNKYIEPFLGGAALFFHLMPKRAVLADLNEELINCYVVVRDDVKALLEELQAYRNESAFYYEVRSWQPENLEPVKRAARTIYLNKTGWNGLYRVNKSGQFNVPFGQRKSPNICDSETLISASSALQGAEIIHADYKETLRKYAQPGDFIFLDPPYHPVGGYSDFKRYTKEFFYEDNHIELRDEFQRLVSIGSYVLLTNSNTTFIRGLYGEFKYKAVNTRRMISSDPATRTGEDLIVIATEPAQKTNVKPNHRHSKLLENFPGTRFMGSKYRVIPFIWEAVKDLQFTSVLDAFSGSGCVSYMFKQQGKQVVSNDFMRFTYYFSKATVENSDTLLTEEDVSFLMAPNPKSGSFIADTFKGLYFSDAENEFLDALTANIELLDDQYKKALAYASIARACMKRRSRGIFTFVGERYDDGRRDLQINLQQHFVENVQIFNKAVFSNGWQNRSLNSDVFDLDVQTDLVYLDPPYYTPNSDNDYTRRYHFVEGLVRHWQGLEFMPKTKTKKFKRYETPFMYKDQVHNAFRKLIERFKNSILVVSYSSNSIPDKTDLTGMLKEYKANVEVHQVEHLYSFGTHASKVGNNANRAQEYIFVAY
jgi:DNA adenine methylase